MSNSAIDMALKMFDAKADQKDPTEEARLRWLENASEKLAGFEYDGMDLGEVMHVLFRLRIRKLQLAGEDENA